MPRVIASAEPFKNSSRNAGGVGGDKYTTRNEKINKTWTSDVLQHSWTLKTLSCMKEIRPQRPHIYDSIHSKETSMGKSVEIESRLEIPSDLGREVENGC